MAKSEAQREVQATVRRAASNINTILPQDPRRYIELRYGVRIDSVHKTLDELEDEETIQNRIRRFTTPRRSMDQTSFERLPLFDSFEGSDTDSDEASDERVREILNAVLGPENVTVPRTDYQEALRDNIAKDGRSLYSDVTEAHRGRAGTRAGQNRDRSLSRDARSIRHQ